MTSPSTPPPLVVLFGYDSSPFTQKVRLSLRLKQIAYIYVTVPSMMPRSILRDNFHVTYRKIPVLVIGLDLYCDTSLILEALEQAFPSPIYRSLYPEAADGRKNRTIIRGFASYWIDRPFFRVTTGLIPSSVWRSSFGVDRAGLIGHKLNPEKLEAKVPQNMSGLDMHLGMFETQFKSATDEYPWIFSTNEPSLADVSLYYQLDWGNDIAAGRGIGNLTGGGCSDTDTEGASAVFNARRYPALWKWYSRMKAYFAALPSTETRVEGSHKDAVKVLMETLKAQSIQRNHRMIDTPASAHGELDSKTGLTIGQKVAIAPDDTGRDNPTLGTLTGISPEGVAIEPSHIDGKRANVEVVIHFPRLGFVVRPVRETKL